MDGLPRALSPVDGSDEYTLWDAAYVLGSLSESDRREYEAHLRHCPTCRQSVDELSGMPALLGLLTADDVAALGGGSDGQPDLPPRILASLLADVSRRRRNARSRTWTVVAATAAAVMVFGVLVGVQFHPGGSAPVSPRADASALTMTPVAPTELTATVTMTGHGWGTQIDMDCTYRDVGTSAAGNESAGRLAMVVVGRDGSHDRLATWVPVDGVTATPAASTSLPIDQIASVQIVAADNGDVLLQRTV
jgi:hypothetical protein